MLTSDTRARYRHPGATRCQDQNWEVQAVRDRFEDLFQASFMPNRVQGCTRDGDDVHSQLGGRDASRINANHVHFRATKQGCRANYPTTNECSILRALRSGPLQARVFVEAQSSKFFLIAFLTLLINERKLIVFE